MFKLLLYPLVKYVTFFNIFQYITFRAVYAALTSLLISFLAGPALIRALRRLKLGQSIREDGPLSHLSKSGTPTMGGALMILSVTISTLLWQDLTSFYSWLFLAALLAFGALGFIDDFLKIKYQNSDGVSARFKSVSQFLISTAIVLALVFYEYRDAKLPGITHDWSRRGLYLAIPFFKDLWLNLRWAYVPFAIFWLVGFSNATNLTDGLDGLLTGLLMLAFAAFAVIAYVSGRVDFTRYLQIPHIPQASELTIPIMAVIGACFGFLWYNCHPAEVFMGDTGSLAFGGALGLLSLMLKKEILLALIGGVFVVETLSVMLQVGYFKYTKKRYGTGRRIFKMAPLHHHWEKLGLPETKVTMRLWILGILFTLIALSTFKIN